MLTSTRAGQPHNTDAIALPPRGHPNTIVVADDTTLVEHRGNAGRPHAAANHTLRTRSQRRPASLRCKPDTSTDTNRNTDPLEPARAVAVLDTPTSTGNAGSEHRCLQRVLYSINGDRSSVERYIWRGVCDSYDRHSTAQW
jgi:hypothetical protein